MTGKTYIENLDKGQVKKETQAILERIGELQYQMAAQEKYSLLIILQGLDASGKDGLTRRLLQHCNPVGISVKSFKKPTAEEYAHDFLWRVHRYTPAKGQITVFVRSHYEDILVPTVEKLFPEDLIEQRYGLINHFEKTIEHNGTKLLKFFLNVSADEQKARLEERLVNPKKYWKHNDHDWETRKKMDQYLAVYQQVMSRCNDIPWHTVPADSNWQKLYFVAKEVLRALESLDLAWPPLKTEIFADKLTNK